MARTFAGKDCSEITLNVLRIMTGFLMMPHGAQKLFGALGREAVPLASLPGVAGVLEFFGGAGDTGGVLYPTGGFRPVRPDGGRLLAGPRHQGLLADSQPGRAGRPLLLRLSLPGGQGRRRLVHRRLHGQEGLTAPVGGRPLAGASASAPHRRSLGL